MSSNGRGLDPRFADYLMQAYRLGCSGSVLDQTVIAVKFASLRGIGDFSRKLPIVSDKSVFYEDLGMVCEEVALASRPSATDLFLTRNFLQIQEWYLSSVDMISSGRISYIPHIAIRWAESLDGFGKPTPVKFLEPSLLFEAVSDSEVMVSDPDIVPLFSLEIPGFQAITPSQLSRVMDDHPDKLLAFRNMIQRKLLEFDSKIGSENFAREVQLLQLELEDEVARLTDAVRQLKKISLIEALGAQGITWTLYIIAFMHDSDNLLKVILPGGLVTFLATSYAKYLRERFEIRRSPFYFLFIVSERCNDLC